jgi:hypothetical protein
MAVCGMSGDFQISPISSFLLRFVRRWFIIYNDCIASNGCRTVNDEIRERESVCVYVYVYVCIEKSGSSLLQDSMPKYRGI